MDKPITRGSDTSSIIWEKLQEWAHKVLLLAEQRFRKLDAPGTDEATFPGRPVPGWERGHNRGQTRNGTGTRCLNLFTHLLMIPPWLA